MRLTILLLVTISLIGCKTAVVPVKQVAYSEDISTLRPETPTSVASGEGAVDNEVLPASNITGDISMELDSVMSLIVERNRQRKFWDGFTIQVYTGLDRDKAYWSRDKIKNLDLGLEPKVEYHQPNYKVKCGEYFDQLEAHGVYEIIKNTFPKALLLPEKLRLTDGNGSD